MEREVPVDEVVMLLHTWLSVLSVQAVVMIDGAVLSDEDKQRLLPRPDALQQYATSLHGALDLVRQGEWDLLRHTQQRTREMADELVRQRGLLHQCLKDCDAVDRSILATVTTDRMASRISVAAAAGPTPKSTFSAHNLLRGVHKLLSGRS